MPRAFLKAREPFSSYSHFIGAVLSGAGLFVLLVPMLVPLIPGGDLYYTTLALVQGDTADFARYGTLFIEEAGAMAFGVILVACLVQTLGKLWLLHSARK